MRSHPYTPPPPLPPLLAELATLLPNRDRRSAEGDKTISLLDLDPETSRLLPVKERPQHCVRVQGRLTPVRSVSTTNLRATSQTRFDTAVSGTPARPQRQRSSDNLNHEMRGEIRERDAQLRSYGIGGRGNIRRPTEVIGTQSESSLSALSLFSCTSSTTHRPSSGPSVDKKFSFSRLLNRIEERRGKEHLNINNDTAHKRSLTRA
ncbi:hypothetical protein F4813DRAFT_143187 [Daldinia decipiens]|uniref:uncharacterized protein n=1 Tax=Daldinia decipiens TaxID=326647 RepID=UPI0020C2FA36|nr:uncharacterized protein F4813DRAFT_143187 [Daldinia decipiens]KAI1656048.1 hypothetical protein F4813DRAFT_143187 [Daldinia decipiens]